jgi:hypothetical protein
MERLVKDFRRLLNRLLGTSNEFYVHDAASHIERAIVAMEEGYRDPELWKRGQLEIAQVFQRLVPFAVRVLNQNSPKVPRLSPGDAYRSALGSGMQRSKSVYF